MEMLPRITISGRKWSAEAMVAPPKKSGPGSAQYQRDLSIIYYRATTRLM
jgi:hypothetical protein